MHPETEGLTVLHFPMGIGHNISPVPQLRWQEVRTDVLSRELTEVQAVALGMWGLGELCFQICVQTDETKQGKSIIYIFLVWGSEAQIPWI